MTTDAKGVATLTCLPGIMMPLSIRVAGPGVAPHTLPLEMPRGKERCPQARPLRTSGRNRPHGIRRATGRRSGGTLGSGVADIRRSDFGESGFGSRRITPDEILRLDPQPLKTGPQGAFQTPSTLLSGSTYRVSIRHDGFVPFVSDWVTLNGERAAIPPIRLQPLGS